MRVATVWGVAVAIGLGFTEAQAELPAASGAGTGCRIVWGKRIADVELSAGVPLGGLSDLAPARGLTRRHFWAITDRGPNGTVDQSGQKMRTLHAPDFAPTIVLLRVPEDVSTDELISVERVLPLAGPQGKTLTGRPTAGPRYVPVLSADASTELRHDPDGVDTEGVVQMKDGSFWVAEEYGPSLLKVGPDGRAMERHVPAGTADSSAAVPHRETIPADYALRRDNRGFEALALSHDDSKLWVMLQSPLDNPEPKAAKKTGNVRLLAFDTAQGKPVAEHVYRMGDPTDSDYLKKGAPPKDGKLCCMAPLGAEGLLVLEQDDEGLARLYAVSLAGATDTLAWKPKKSSDARSLEEVRDLTKAGIEPVAKRLVADLTEYRNVMAAQSDGGELRNGALKLEGLAVIDDRHVLIANDDDFGVHGKGKHPRRSFLWLIELEKPLPSLAAGK